MDGHMQAQRDSDRARKEEREAESDDDMQCPICGSLTRQSNVDKVLGPIELAASSGSVPVEGFTLILDAGQRAMNERDQYNRWIVELAGLLGVAVGDFGSDETAEQYGELRKRITAHAKAQNERDQP